MRSDALSVGGGVLGIPGQVGGVKRGALSKDGRHSQQVVLGHLNKVSAIRSAGRTSSRQKSSLRSGESNLKRRAETSRVDLNCHVAGGAGTSRRNLSDRSHNQSKSDEQLQNIFFFLEKKQTRTKLQAKKQKKKKKKKKGKQVVTKHKQGNKKRRLHCGKKKEKQKRKKKKKFGKKKGRREKKKLLFFFPFQAKKTRHASEEGQRNVVCLAEFKKKRIFRFFFFLFFFFFFFFLGPFTARQSVKESATALQTRRRSDDDVATSK